MIHSAEASHHCNHQGPTLHLLASQHSTALAAANIPSKASQHVLPAGGIKSAIGDHESYSIFPLDRAKKCLSGHASGSVAAGKIFISAYGWTHFDLSIVRTQMRHTSPVDETCTCEECACISAVEGWYLLSRSKSFVSRIAEPSAIRNPRNSTQPSPSAIVKVAVLTVLLEVIKQRLRIHS